MTAPRFAPATAALGFACAIASGAAAQDAHLIAVAGLGGEPETETALHEQVVRLCAAAETRHGVPRQRIVCLASDPARDPRRIDGRSTREGVQDAFARTASRARPGDLVLVVLLGHGSYQSGISRFALPGPDLTAEDFAALVGELGEQRVVFVNATSASGEFAKALAGPSRALLLATRSGAERNQTEFGRYFVDALAHDGADADKDGRVSLQEAFDHAKRETDRAYEQDKRLLTEHATLVDATGLAKAAYLAGGSSSEPAAADPRLRALIEERRALEDRVERLKAGKADLPEEEYQRMLEDLLVALAEKSEAIRAAQAAGREPR
ncbi:MAG: hypothetical protein AB7O37_06535 [Vicinamibacteria bacterium]